MGSRLELPPRLVDWSILGAVCFAVATGLLGLVSGRTGDAWVFVTHGIGGLSLVLLLFWKLRRVRHRVTSRAAWDRYTPFSILLGAVAIAALATGVYWTFGGRFGIGPWTGLFVHMALGVLVVPLLLIHLRGRFRAPSTDDFAGRRTALSGVAVVGFGALTWRLQRGANRLFGLAGADHRFTGSREDGSGEGNAFPVTSWVADDPDPIDPDDWQLRVGGRVERELAFDGGALDSDAGRRAVLDCTSGWYSTHDWQGIRIGDLLDSAEPTDEAQWISFRSVTGYRWSLPIEEARDALLATHVDGERLSHGHGFPLRLVAPGRRGFQWVKWVESVEVRRKRDMSEWVAIFVSGFDEASADRATDRR
ncbi:molybdopterin-dependent oxidoreductase [Halococcus saccharolyticus]|uniref:Sulfite oxidase-like oxidoreductase n=1 Tax=Halococcus saccharolyticus DSM 5350 TaxID=1227455 RepID=M0MEE2_9EURY|nr:molybdopterin-dependent oxidoreductase [Halococcus saccharolyticus]EMA42785.1 sulfite oxidase-like oxidoreductase [Halococcus saccharolyticus DSM 5350]